jgi:hypothetical protein
MPHVPKSVTHLSSQGSMVRPELTQGVRSPQAKETVPVRKPKKQARRNPFMSRISPKTYDGAETHPDEVMRTLFGEIEENERGVMVRKRKSDS